MVRLPAEGEETSRRTPQRIPWCVLGTLEFRLLTSPSRFRTGWSYNYVEHERIEGKPTLQQVGGNLREIELEFQFHSEFCDPEQQLQDLIDLGDRGEAVALVIGTVFQNYWVLVDIPVTWRKTDAEARLISIEVRVTLREWVGVKLERRPRVQAEFARRARAGR